MEVDSINHNISKNWIGVRTGFCTIGVGSRPIFKNRKLADHVLGPYKSREGGQMDY